MPATVKTGDIWEAFGHVDVFAFCSGVEYNADTEGLVMRDGLALQILEKMPDVDIVLWNIIKRFMDKTKMGQLDYRPFVGFAYVKNKKHNQTIGLFQTKGLWIDKAHPFVVANSFSELVKFTYLFVAAEQKAPTIVVDNPAEGQLASHIIALFDYLPANITIYKDPEKGKPPKIKLKKDNLD